MEHRPDAPGALLVRTLALALAAVLAAAGAAAAQGHGGEKGGHGGMEERGGHGMEMQRGHRMHGDHGAMLGRVPAAVLRQGELLELSDDQRRRLEALSDSVETVRRDRGGERGATRQRLASAFGENGIDVEAYESALRAIRATRTRCAIRRSAVARRADS